MDTQAQGIDPDSEELITLQQATTKFPGRRRIGIATLFRWASTGVRGVKLETLHVGRSRFTSVEAIGRFIQAQNQGSSPQPVVTAKRRKSMAQSAVSQLEAAGA